MENNKAKIIILILMFVVLVLQITCVIPSLIGCMIVLGLKGIIDLLRKTRRAGVCEALPEAGLHRQPAWAAVQRHRRRGRRGPAWYSCGSQARGVPEH